jgi:tetratricopeptide (TPR) repeat protein
MSSLQVLRKQVEYQQYAKLREAAQNLWDKDCNPAVLPLLALAYAHLGQRKPAEDYFAQAIEHQAEFDADSLIDLAAVLIVMLRFDEAVELLEQALVKQPEHALGLARLAYCRMLLGELESAQQLFRQAVDIEPERIPILNNLANVYLLRENYQQAQAVLDQANLTLVQIGEELPDIACKQHSKLLNTMQLQIWVATEQFAVAEEWLREQRQLEQDDEIETAELVGWVNQYSCFLAERDLHQQAADILREYLKACPDNSALCLQLAELAQVQGHFMSAVNLLHRALKQDEENVALWVQLSSACLHRFDIKARKAAEKALELAGALEESEELPLPLIRMQRAQAKNALALVESHEQNYAVSEQMFREILAEHEYFVPALQGLGQQQMQQGQLDEALELFERVKKIDPIKGNSSLINARRFPEDIETLEQMELAAQRPSLEGSVRAGILFQLAAAWEKCKEYDKAFEFARQANESSKKFLPYNGKAHRNQCARTRAGFSKPLYQHRPDCGIDSTLPVYVLGMPRSGTTLVEQILSGHSQIFGAGELGVIPQVIQGLNRWERHVGSGRSYPDCVDDLTPAVTAKIANNILKELREYAPDAKHIVDKLPHNFENIGLIKFLFPNARIISVRRDPRDIAMSNYFTDYQAKHGGMGFAYDLSDIGEQLADHNMMMHHWQRTFPGEILELNYEDVIDDLEGSARKMLDYIGVDWEPRVLRFNELERPVKTASVWQVRQPIYKTSKAKWMRYQQHLAPLIKGTNAKILPDPVENMFSLPEPGFLTDGVELYRKGDLDGAELSFKKMLHHNPEHAACNYMVGLVYLSKNHPYDGISQLEKALKKAPWQKEWRENLIKAYELTGQHGKIDELDNLLKNKDRQVEESAVENQVGQGWTQENSSALIDLLRNESP